MHETRTSSWRKTPLGAQTIMPTEQMNVIKAGEPAMFTATPFSEKVAVPCHCMFICCPCMWCCYSCAMPKVRGIPTGATQLKPAEVHYSRVRGFCKQETSNAPSRVQETHALIRTGPADYLPHARTLVHPALGSGWSGWYDVVRCELHGRRSRWFDCDHQVFYLCLLS